MPNRNGRAPHRAQLPGKPARHMSGHQARLLLPRIPREQYGVRADSASAFANLTAASHPADFHVTRRLPGQKPGARRYHHQPTNRPRPHHSLPQGQTRPVSPRGVMPDPGGGGTRTCRRREPRQEGGKNRINPRKTTVLHATAPLIGSACAAPAATKGGLKTGETP